MAKYVKYSIVDIEYMSAGERTTLEGDYIFYVRADMADAVDKSGVISDMMKKTSSQIVGFVVDKESKEYSFNSEKVMLSPVDLLTVDNRGILH